MTIQNWQTMRLLGASLALSLGLVLAGSGCNGDGSPDASRQTATGLEVSQPTPQGGPTTGLPAGPSCVSSDPNHLCIGIKAVAYKDSSGVPSLTEAQTSVLLGGVNAVWSVCNIAFQLEKYDQVNPADYGLSYGSASQGETTSIRSAFDESNTFLIVSSGPWTGNTIAWTAMPGGGPYGVVVDAQYATNQYTVGHELGHYQGLDHVNDTNNLMNPVILATTSQLNSSQCDLARATDLSTWTAMLRH